jgi:hypothetical protein
MTNAAKYAAAVVLVLVCTWIGLDLRGAHESKKSAAAEQQSIVQQQAATASAAQGGSNVQVAQEQAATVAQDDAAVARDRVKVAQHRPAPVPVPPASPAAPEPAAQPVAEDDGTAQLIADQAKEIQDLKAQVATLNLAVTHYKGAYEDEAKASALKEIALQAQIAANRSSLWKGRIEGFAFGVAAGYVGGKL